MRRWTALALLATALFVGAALYYTFNSSDERQVRNDASHSPVARTRLLGEVVDGAGERLGGATLCAYGSESANRLERECVSADASGDYVLDLAPGRYEITASALNHTSAHAKVTLAAHDEHRLDLTLESQAPTLIGIVKSASGFSIPGAHVTISQGERVISNVSTNQTGVFSAWTSDGQFIVSAAAEGFGSASVRTSAPARDVKITLFPGNSVSGQVLLEGSLQPVANVRVSALHRENRVADATADSMVRTDEHGRFHFPNLSAGAWFLTVADNHLWGTLSSPVQVTLDQTIDNITLIVRPASRIAGRFVVGENGQACPSGMLQLISTSITERARNDKDGRISNQDSNAEPIFTAAVKDDGAVEFEAVPYGSYQVGPICNEYLLARGPTTLDVNREETSDLVWNFQRGANIVASVVDESRKPVAQAIVALAPTNAVELSRGELLFARRSGQTDANGKYSFGGLPAGRYRVSARYPALIGDRTTTDEVDTSMANDGAITLVLPTPGLIRVHAHDASGAPLSQILFFAINEIGTRYEANFTGDGRFVVGPMPEDSYRVYAYDNKNAKIPLNDGRALAIRGGESIDLDFTYDAPNGALEGRVVDGSGVPMSETLVRAVSTTLDANDERFSGIQVSIHGAQELMTNRDGRFRIEGLNPNAAYDLYIDHRSGLKDVRHNIVPGTFLDIALPLTATVVGKVLDAGNKPLHQFDVFIEAENKTTRSQSFKNADGQFKLENIYPGRLQITVIDPSGSILQRDLQTTPGQIADMGIMASTSGAQVNSGK